MERINQKLENVVKALQLCRYDPDPGQECKQLVSCDICPYWYDDEYCYGCHETAMFNDALEVIKDLRQRLNEPTKAEIKHAISNIDRPKDIDEEQFFIVMASIYAALAKLYGETVPSISPSKEDT